MVSKEEIVAMLESLSLSRAEAEVYLILLEKEKKTATDLANISHYSRTKIYEIMETLIDQGLVDMFPTRPAQYRAKDPQYAIEMLISKEEARLSSLKKTVIPDLSNLYDTPDTNEIEVWINQGFDACISKYHEVISSAQDEIVCLWGWISKKELPLLIKALEVLKKKGVSIEIYCIMNNHFEDQISEDDIKIIRSFITSFHEINFPFELETAPPVKGAMVDSKEIVGVIAEFEKNKIVETTSIHYRNLFAPIRLIKHFKSNYLPKLLTILNNMPPFLR